jgi:hypothetical protein
MSIIRLILLFVIIYFIFKLLRVMVYSYLYNRKRERYTYDEVKEEGKTTVTHIPKEEKLQGGKKGNKEEYIDFEEVE